MLIYMPTDRPKKKKLKITKEEEAALVPVKQLGFLVQKQESKEDFWLWVCGLGVGMGNS